MAGQRRDDQQQRHAQHQPQAFHQEAEQGHRAQQQAHGALARGNGQHAACQHPGRDRGAVGQAEHVGDDGHADHRQEDQEGSGADRRRVAAPDAQRRGAQHRAHQREYRAQVIGKEARAHVGR